MEFVKMQIETITSIVLPPLTAAIGWIAGTRKRRNDAICYMQKTIDDLAAKNAEYMGEITQLRAEVAKLQAENTKLQQGQASMQAKLDEIGRENSALRTIIEKRTITSKAETPKPKTKKQNGNI